MAIDKYLTSKRFLIFQDKELRVFACNMVDCFLDKFKQVKGSQLNSIPAIIQAGGLNELKKLCDQQRSKNTNERNKAFWDFLHSVIFDDADSGNSLRRCVVKELSGYRDASGSGIFDDEASHSDKIGKKKARKENNSLVDKAVNELIGTFFEHFNCHYFYKALKERGRE
ncbi:MAG: hypothetical protein HYV59_03985 [Planctomycetes bacterium]|nr:hypothetical protein [Planctomycetota bacterium]